MDKITCFFMRKFKEIIREPVCRLFNQILLSKKVPETWKIARITPVYKKGLTTAIENYRPVSNLNALPKLFEICLLQRLERLNIDELVSTAQHGFRKHHGTETAVASLVSKVVDGLEAKDQVSIYSADLTAAFDVLRKEVLVGILIKKNVPIYLVNIIHEYLSDRMAYVQIESSRSMLKDIRAGCIQGSVLGPFLFSIYMSDLESVVLPHQLVAYADDSYIVIKEKTLNLLKQKTSDVMEAHFNWLGQIGMVCNQAKTELMFMNTDSVELIVNNQRIVSKPTMKVLGMMMDNNLKWESQVNKIVSKVKSLNFGLRYLRRHLSITEIRPILFSQVISHITYGCMVWFHALNYKQKTKIKSTFYQTLRIITRDFKRRQNRNILVRDIGINHIEDIMFLRSSVFLFNIIFHMVPTDIVYKLLGRSYFNDRNLGKLHFFDYSTSKIGRACLTNCAGSLSSRWTFDWFMLTPNSFKHHLKRQIASSYTN